MTPQQIFDTVATHLFAQGEQAIDGQGSCVYRSDNGLKCAVGCLIPDESYTTEMEGNAAQDLGTRFNLPEWFKDNGLLLQELQEVHDNEGDAWGELDGVKACLISIALEHELDYSVLEDLPAPEGTS